ncbi:hypothetical protein BV22DRAFT_1129647 [Leucogyrophana mollusca]|uniref:Uncharacterized protein n=1 Tax=Leucogyrophana mollusca TaxID=85980 RepID=A0ACB8BFR4_9AGAM|nr:hypothetical protein BV22DRAFT_1129647 [Leucogyrophana mollusca]
MAASGGVRTSFDDADDELLAKFIATYNPAKQGRSGNAIYQRLVDNMVDVACTFPQADGRWNWSQHHTWQAWRNRYVKNTDWFDRRILKYQKKHGIDSVTGKPPRAGAASNVKLAARGEKSVDEGDANAAGPSNSTQSKKRRVPRSGDAGTPETNTAKRIKVEIDEVETATQDPLRNGCPIGASNRGETVINSEVDHTALLDIAAGPSGTVSHEAEEKTHNGECTNSPHRSPSTRSPERMPESAPGANPELEERHNHTHVDVHIPEGQADLNYRSQVNGIPPVQASVLPPVTPPKAQGTTSTSSHAQPYTSVLNIPPSPARRTDTLALPSSPPSPQPQSHTKPKLALKPRRPVERYPSEFYASLSPTPSGTQERAEGNRRRVLPRSVEGHFGHSIVDRRGRPRTGVYQSDDESDGDGRDDMAQRQLKVEMAQPWPPARGTAMRPSQGVKMASAVGPKGKEKARSEQLGEQANPRADVPTQATASSSRAHPELAEPARHHAFSQPGPMVPAAHPRTHHPFSQVDAPPPPIPIPNGRSGQSYGPESPLKSRSRQGRRMVMTQFIERNAAQKPPDSVQRADDVLAASGSSTAMPQPMDHPGIWNTRVQPAKPFKFPAPRESTRSPFRVPALPASTSRPDKGKGRAKVPPITDSNHRRQTFGGYADIPDIDLAAELLRSQSSQSLTSRRPRQSLPAYLTSPGSYLAANASISSSANLSLSGLVSPSSIHPSDRDLSALVGFEALIKGISKNHGYTENIVLEVYNRVENLKEADEVLHKMKMAAADRGEIEIRKKQESREWAWGGGDRTRNEDWSRARVKRRESLDYEPASVDGEGSEYEPPSTSRAARYKRMSIPAYISSPPEQEDGDEAEVESMVDIAGDGMPGQSWIESTPAASAPAPAPVISAEAEESAVPPTWSEEEDRMARSGSEEALKKLEERVGKGSLRRRIVRLLQ